MAPAKSVRFLIQRPVYERFVTAFVAATAKLVIGDGMDAGTQVGPLANQRQLEKMELLVADVPMSALIMHEEPFGPIAVMIGINQYRIIAGDVVDLILDFIGAPYLERNVNALNFGGRLVQVGIMGGIENAKIPLDRLLYRHLQIFGTVMKSRSQEVKHAMSQRFRDRWLSEFGKEGLTPIIDSVYPLAEAAAAHQRMEEGLNVGKIVLTA